MLDGLWRSLRNYHKRFQKPVIIENVIQCRPYPWTTNFICSICRRDYEDHLQCKHLAGRSCEVDGKLIECVVLDKETIKE